MFAQNHDDLNDYIKQADKLFESNDFKAAYPYYQTLRSNNNKNADYNFRLGVCMMFSEPENKTRPVKYFDDAIKLEIEDNRVYYYLGRALHNNYRFSEAQTSYSQYKELAKKRLVASFDIDRRIQECKNGISLLAHIKLIYVIEKQLVRDQTFYKSYNFKESSGRVIAVPPTLKTKYDKKNSSPKFGLYVSEGKMIYYASYGKKGETGLDIYRAKQIDDSWGNVESLGDNVNTKYDDAYPYITSDGKTLYFSSKGHNSMGGYDVFKSKFSMSSFEWGKCENLNFPTNTPFDDLFYVPDTSGVMAYFSSDRQSLNGEIYVYHIGLDVNADEQDLAQAFRDGSDATDIVRLLKDIAELKTNINVEDYKKKIPKDKKKLEEEKEILAQEKEYESVANIDIDNTEDLEKIVDESYIEYKKLQYKAIKLQRKRNIIGKVISENKIIAADLKSKGNKESKKYRRAAAISIEIAEELDAQIIETQKDAQLVLEETGKMQKFAGENNSVMVNNSYRVINRIKNKNRNLPNIENEIKEQEMALIEAQRRKSATIKTKIDNLTLESNELQEELEEYKVAMNESNDQEERQEYAEMIAMLSKDIDNKHKNKEILAIEYDSLQNNADAKVELIAAVETILRGSKEYDNYNREQELTEVEVASIDKVINIEKDKIQSTVIANQVSETIASNDSTLLEEEDSVTEIIAENSNKDETSADDQNAETKAVVVAAVTGSNDAIDDKETTEANAIIADNNTVTKEDSTIIEDSNKANIIAKLSNEEIDSTINIATNETDTDSLSESIAYNSEEEFKPVDETKTDETEVVGSEINNSETVNLNNTVIVTTANVNKSSNNDTIDGKIENEEPNSENDIASNSDKVIGFAAVGNDIAVNKVENSENKEVIANNSNEVIDTASTVLIENNDEQQTRIENEIVQENVDNAESLISSDENSTTEEKVEVTANNSNEVADSASTVLIENNDEQQARIENEIAQENVDNAESLISSDENSTTEEKAEVTANNSNEVADSASTVLIENNDEQQARIENEIASVAIVPEGITDEKDNANFDEETNSKQAITEEVASNNDVQSGMTSIAVVIPVVNKRKIEDNSKVINNKSKEIESSIEHNNLLISKLKLVATEEYAVSIEKEKEANTILAQANNTDTEYVQNLEKTKILLFEAKQHRINAQLANDKIAEGESQQKINAQAMSILKSLDENNNDLLKNYSDSSFVKNNEEFEEIVGTIEIGKLVLVDTYNSEPDTEAEKTIISKVESNSAQIPIDNSDYELLISGEELSAISLDSRIDSISKLEDNAMIATIDTDSIYVPEFKSEQNKEASETYLEPNIAKIDSVKEDKTTNAEDISRSVQLAAKYFNEKENIDSEITTLSEEVANVDSPMQKHEIKETINNKKQESKTAERKAVAGAIYSKLLVEQNKEYDSIIDVLEAEFKQNRELILAGNIEEVDNSNFISISELEVNNAIVNKYKDDKLQQILIAKEKKAELEKVKSEEVVQFESLAQKQDKLNNEIIDISSKNKKKKVEAELAVVDTKIIAVETVIDSIDTQILEEEKQIAKNEYIINEFDTISHFLEVSSPHAEKDTAFVSQIELVSKVSFDEDVFLPEEMEFATEEDELNEEEIVIAQQVEVNETQAYYRGNSTDLIYVADVEIAQVKRMLLLKKELLIDEEIKVLNDIDREKYVDRISGLEEEKTLILAGELELVKYIEDNKGETDNLREINDSNVIADLKKQSNRYKDLAQDLQDSSEYLSDNEKDKIILLSEELYQYADSMDVELFELSTLKNENEIQRNNIVMVKMYQETENSVAKNQALELFNYAKLNYELSVKSREALKNPDLTEDEREQFVNQAIQYEELSIADQRKAIDLLNSEVVIASKEDNTSKEEVIEEKQDVVDEKKQDVVEEKLDEEKVVAKEVIIEEPIAQETNNNVTVVNSNTKIRTMDLATFVAVDTKELTSKQTVDYQIRKSEIVGVYIAPKGKSTEDFYSESKKIKVNVENPMGIIYKVQIAAFKKPIPQNTFKGITPISAETIPNSAFTRYLAGIFVNIDDASAAKKTIRSVGYKDAFIVAYYNGKRVSMATVRKIIASGNAYTDSKLAANSNKLQITNYGASNEKQKLAESNYSENTGILITDNNNVSSNGLTYSVQIGVFGGLRTSARLNNIHDLFYDRTTKGYYRYFSGTYDNESDAKNQRSIVRNSGIKDAFIVVFLNGKRISLNKARSISNSNGDAINNINTQENANATKNNADNNQKVVSGNIVYKIQIGAFRSERAGAQLESLKQISLNGIDNYTNTNGLLAYTSKAYTSYNQAVTARTQIRNNGYTDVFIVAFENGKRISVRAARNR
ncbi:MAG: hypothetical protein B6I18_01755 [Bacteroidetes bacterium 4572_112]|nr:MAG: hypothetical protein B6I18_01755 [Bacteroidetes bacterium 4572_112]